MPVSQERIDAWTTLAREDLMPYTPQQECRTWEQALAWGGQTSCTTHELRLLNNMRLLVNPGSEENWPSACKWVALIHYGTPIITYLPGRYIITCGGHVSRSTAERFKAHLPPGMYSNFHAGHYEFKPLAGWRKLWRDHVREDSPERGTTHLRGTGVVTYIRE